MGGYSKSGWPSVSGLGGGGNSGGGFRTIGYAFDPSPSTSHSVSSASSLEGGAVGEPSTVAGAQSHVDTHMQGTYESDIEPYPGYRYYPGALYEGLPGVKGETGFSAEDKSSGVKEEFGHSMHMKTGSGRLLAVDGSKGWYPDFYTTTG